MAAEWQRSTALAPPFARPRHPRRRRTQRPQDRRTPRGGTRPPTARARGSGSKTLGAAGLISSYVTWVRLLGRNSIAVADWSINSLAFFFFGLTLSISGVAKSHVCPTTAGQSQRPPIGNLTGGGLGEEMTPQRIAPAPETTASQPTPRPQNEAQSSFGKAPAAHRSRRGGVTTLRPEEPDVKSTSSVL